MENNFLSSIEFGFSINRLPNVSFYVQSVNFPEVSTNAVDLHVPFKTLHFGANKLEYGDLQISFKIDENFQCYKEIFSWLQSHNPDYSGEQYKRLQASSEGLTSDATLIILNSKKNPNITILFKDIFPISISNIEFDVKQENIVYPTLDVVFKHHGFTII